MPASRTRRDVERNRQRLLESARMLFADEGPDVPLEQIARSAAVSRTTLHRHFSSRDALIAQLHEENVTRIEELAAQWRDEPDGLIRLYDAVFEMEVSARGMAWVLSRSDDPEVTTLAERTAHAFASLLPTGAGLLQPGVGVRELLLTFPMAEAAFAAERLSGAEPDVEAIRRLLHRAVFRT